MSSSKLDDRLGESEKERQEDQRQEGLHIKYHKASSLEFKQFSVIPALGKCTGLPKIGALPSRSRHQC